MRSSRCGAPGSVPRRERPDRPCSSSPPRGSPPTWPPTRVAARWADESACAGMTVGGLAHHLAGQAATPFACSGARRPRGADPPRASTTAGPPGSPPGPTTSPTPRSATSPTTTRSGGPRRWLEQVAPGPGRAAGGAADAPRRRPDTVFVPWQGWSLTTEDFLVTRLMEIMVHSDDLAASVGLPTPQFPDAAVRGRARPALGGRRRPARPDGGAAGAEPAAAGARPVSAF